MPTDPYQIAALSRERDGLRELLAETQQRITQLERRERELRGHVEYALKLLGDAGSNSEHDPSWIRPRKLTREQVNECCIQAYHALHQALTPPKEEKP